MGRLRILNPGNNLRVGEGKHSPVKRSGRMMNESGRQEEQ